VLIFLILFNCGWALTFYFTSYSEVLNTHLAKVEEKFATAKCTLATYPPHQKLRIRAKRLAHSHFSLVLLLLRSKGGKKTVSDLGTV
jgi:hypothetical protein